MLEQQRTFCLLLITCLASGCPCLFLLVAYLEFLWVVHGCAAVLCSRYLGLHALFCLSPPCRPLVLSSLLVL